MLYKIHEADRLAGQPQMSSGGISQPCRCLFLHPQWMRKRRLVLIQEAGLLGCRSLLLVVWLRAEGLAHHRLHGRLVHRSGSRYVGCEGGACRHQVVFHRLAIRGTGSNADAGGSMPFSVTRYSLVFTARSPATSTCTACLPFLGSFSLAVDSPTTTPSHPRSSADREQPGRGKPWLRCPHGSGALHPL